MGKGWAEDVEPSVELAFVTSEVFAIGRDGIVLREEGAKELGFEGGPEALEAGLQSSSSSQVKSMCRGDSSRLLDRRDSSVRSIGSSLLPDGRERKRGRELLVDVSREEDDDAFREADEGAFPLTVPLLRT